MITVMTLRDWFFVGCLGLFILTFAYVCFDYYVVKPIRKRLRK